MPDQTYGWVTRRGVEAYAGAYAREHPGVNAEQLRGVLRQRFLAPIDYTQAALAAASTPQPDPWQALGAVSVAVFILAPLFAAWHRLFSKSEAQVDALIDAAVTTALAHGSAE